MKTNNLLKSMIIFGLIGVFFTGSVLAGNPAKGLAVKYQPIHDKMEKTVKFPADCFAKLHNGETADVLFTLSDEGKVNVINISSECPEMAESLKKQLEDVYCPDVIHEYNQHFKITFKFRTV